MQILHGAKICPADILASQVPCLHKVSHYLSIKIVMPKFDEVRWFMRLKVHPFVTRCFYSTIPQ